MLNRNCSLALAAALSLTLGARAALAFDASIPAFPGTPATPSEAACWSNSGGALVNNCSGTRRTCIPLSIPASRGTPVSAWVSVNDYAASSANRVSCFAQSVDRWGSLGPWSGWESTGVYGKNDSMTLGLTVPFAYNLYVCCDVQPGGIVASVDYSY